MRWTHRLTGIFGDRKKFPRFLWGNAHEKPEIVSPPQVRERQTKATRRIRPTSAGDKCGGFPEVELSLVHFFFFTRLLNFRLCLTRFLLLKPEVGLLPAEMLVSFTVRNHLERCRCPLQLV